MARDAIGVGVADGDERLVPIRFGFDGAGGPQQRAVRRAFKAFLDGVRAHKYLIPKCSTVGLNAGPNYQWGKGLSRARIGSRESQGMTTAGKRVGRTGAPHG